MSAMGELDAQIRAVGIDPRIVDLMLVERVNNKHPELTTIGVICMLYGRSVVREGESMTSEMLIILVAIHSGTLFEKTITGMYNTSDHLEENFGVNIGKLIDIDLVKHTHRPCLYECTHRGSQIVSNVLALLNSIL